MRSILLTLGFVATFSAPAFAQDEKADDNNRKANQILLDRAKEQYRTFFREPKTAFEFWSAIKFEIGVGKFDLAAFFLKGLVAKQPADQVDEDLFKIEAVEGTSSFLRLIRVQRWSDHAPHQKEAEENVKIFFERLNAILEKKLADPVRINKFISQLVADTPEERAYAFTQLNRSRERAVPYLVEKLRESVGKPLFAKITETLVNMDAESVPAYLEVLKARDDKDAQDQDLRLALLRVLRNRVDRRVIPYLWHLSAAAKYPPLVREVAGDMLSEFLNVDRKLLPSPKLALAELSEKYYRHQVRLADKTRLWPWDGQKVAVEPIELKAADVEELFGLRYAIEAVDLDRSFERGQIAFLNLTIERTILAEFDQAVLKPMPTAAQRLLATLDPDLLMRVLDRAYDDKNIPVLIGTIQALGNRGETRAAKPSAFGLPQGVIRGLYYPDRRVQYTAVNALLKMPIPPNPIAASRTVDVLTRMILVDQPPIALILGASVDKANAVADAMKAIGLQPVMAKTAIEGFDKVRTLGNLEAIVLHYGMKKEFAYALSQLSADIDIGTTPVLIVAPQDRTVEYKKMASRYKNVRVLAENVIAGADEVKRTLDEINARVSVAKLSAEERKRLSETSLDILRQMARNQIAGYNVQPALDNVVTLVNSPDLGLLAVETLGRLPGTAAQMRLADVVLDPTKEKLRVPAARELNRHAQFNGVLMSSVQLDKIRRLYRDAASELALRTELAYFIGAFRTTPTRDGNLIFQYRPDEAPAPAPPAEKK